jgi:hypothetical protein
MNRAVIAVVAVCVLLPAWGAVTGAQNSPPASASTGAPNAPTPTLTSTPVAPTPTSTPSTSLPPIPPGVPQHFSFGLFNATASQIPSGVPWDLRYQYLVGGVNTGGGWYYWNTNGAYVNNYIAASRAMSLTSSFVYYQILQSEPHYDEYDNLQDPQTMYDYYEDWKRLMQRCAMTGVDVLVNIEPDLNGVMQQHSSNTGDDAARQPARVAASGHADAQGYPDNFRGFYQALAHIRDLYAPRVRLGLDVSNWAAGADIAISLRNDPNYNWQAHATRTANYLNSFGPGFDLLFYSPLDRDAAYYQSNGSNRWWDSNNVTQPTFNTMGAWLGRIVSVTHKRALLWQVPNGNRVYRTMNNSNGHWQDNRAEYFLNEITGDAHIGQWADLGVVGLMFGAGVGSQTHYFDYNNDGVTNPAPINGNDRLSTFPDDDGGYIRLGATAYYAGGTIPLPGSSCIGIAEFNALRRAYGTVLGDPAYNPAVDFNADGRVNSVDYTILRSLYGRC